MTYACGISMNKPPFDSLQICVELPVELRGSLLCESELMGIEQESLLPESQPMDTESIVIRPISQEAMEDITHRAAKEVHHFQCGP